MFEHCKYSLKKIVIFIAMLDEARPMIAHYQMTQTFSYLKNHSSFIQIYSCLYKKVEILLVTPGVDPRYQVDRVGPVPAALAVCEILHQICPDILINAGTAGGFSGRNASVGDVYLAKSPVKYHDRRISWGNFRDYGVGSFDCLSLDEIAGQLNLKQGILSTGSSLDKNPADLEELEQHQADLKEMEAAAIAETCYLMGFSQVVFIKAITNLLDQNENSAEQFQANLTLASHNLARKLYELIDLLV